MPATKIKSLHSTAGSENIWQLQMWDQAQNHFKETKLLSTRFISFLLPEFQEAHPITKVDP